MSRRLVRKIRNISSAPAEIKIKSATSNDSFGPTSQDLNEIALFTSSSKDLKQITNVLTKRLNDHTRNWRHIIKCLTVVQFCLLAGSSEFVRWMRDNMYLIATLQEFQMGYNEDTAHHIRSKSRKITKLLKDKTLLDDKRSNFHALRSSMSRPSIDKRSSLDIHRMDLEIEEVPLSPTALDRRGQSLEIKRTFENDRELSPARHEVIKMLDDIVEE
ncbi:Epsin-1 [Cyberlindnera fabianii]|uniref:Epsin-1 n=1 Tax=Cyberlindnera fabianii TaxID=36022 RepID=A0A1V2L6H0_CYBFA|nr:Epsin-1 [Cyberlindnera fabianii]